MRHVLTILCCTLAGGGGSIAADDCQDVLRAGGVGARGLYLTPGRPVAVHDGATLSRSQGARLAYIVPNYQFDSGALIVKLQHRQLRTNEPADKVVLERAAYRSPCDLVERVAFSKTRSIAEYRNYHRYFATDFSNDPTENFDSFHADVGLRPAPIFYDRSRQDCLRTRSTSVRFQALFGEDRSPASYLERGAWLAGPVVRPFAAAVAQTPPTYSGFQTLVTRIIPYAKAAQSHRCVVIDAKPPSDAFQTVLSIVDADEASGAYGTVRSDGHDSWTLNWTGNLKALR